MSTALAVVEPTNVDLYRRSTDAASLCKGIVTKTAQTIQGRQYVKVEGWQAIAIAHGCTGSARDVEAVPGGVRAIGEVRRMSDGAVIAEAEGFVGEDEPTWFGGRMGNKTLPKRADYAIRAMAQTRAISRACRSAFAHVVVMMDAGLSTTPAEEVPAGGFDDEPRGEPTNVTPIRQAAAPKEKPAKADELSISERVLRAQRALAEAPDLIVLEQRFAAMSKLCAELSTTSPGLLTSIERTHADRKEALSAKAEPEQTPFDDPIPF